MFKTTSYVFQALVLSCTKVLLEPLGQDHLREEVFCVGIPQTSTVLPDTNEGINKPQSFDLGLSNR